MKIITNVWDTEPLKDSVITIGTFDGVHLGHRKIIQRLVNSARSQQLVPTVFTFFPHPRMILQPEVAPKQIQTVEEKAHLMEILGVEQLVIQPFDRKFADLPAENFVQQILVEKLRVKKIIVGYDHRFGKNRTADIHDLQHFGEKYGFEVEEISAQEIDDVKVSSTKIRQALADGDIKQANVYLQSSFTLSGKVIHGQKLGKRINFPTANILISESYKLIPKIGVYAVESIIEGKKMFGMMNIGKNPTIEGKGDSVEVHFFDFQGDLYGKVITLHLIDYIREEQKFSSVEALRMQLEKDEKVVREIFKMLKK